MCIRDRDKALVAPPDIVSGRTTSTTITKAAPPETYALDISVYVSSVLVRVTVAVAS